MCLQLLALEVIPSSRDWEKMRGGRGAKGGGTPRFTYDNKRGVYINNKVTRYSDL